MTVLNGLLGFPGSFRCAAISQLFQAWWNVFQFVAKSPLSSNLEGNGRFIGICTRFGCVVASCTCTEAPLPSGFGGILSILKLVRFLQLRFPSENTQQFHSPLSFAVLCEEVVEWLFQNTVETGGYPLQ